MDTTFSPHFSLKPLVLSMALALPASLAFGGPMDDAVARDDCVKNEHSAIESSRRNNAASSQSTAADALGAMDQSASGSDIAMYGSSASDGLGADEQTDAIALENEPLEDAGPSDDATAKEYNRGYYPETEAVAMTVIEDRLVLIDDGTEQEYNRGYYPEVEASELVMVDHNTVAADDDTAHWYDRGYYQEPEQIAALVIMPSDEYQQPEHVVSNDATDQRFDRGYYKEPYQVVAIVVAPAGEDADNAPEDGNSAEMVNAAIEQEQSATTDESLALAD